MNLSIHPSWKSHLANSFKQPYFQDLQVFVEREYETQTVFPPKEKIFAAFQSLPFDAVKVVIIGQDPYHGFGQANGLCFSVNRDVKIPASLRNIFKELQGDLGMPPPHHGDLTSWVEQGVFLLNATLTVRAKSPGSHQKKGWEIFTDTVIQKLSDERVGLIFLLWGNYAQEKGKVIDESKHFVLKTTHPSPFSAHQGFLGCQHFSLCNEILMQNGKKPIDWILNEQNPNLLDFVDF